MIRENKNGFSLVEVLIAGAILSLSAVVLCSISTRCMGHVKLDQQYELAWQLMDRQLETISYIGIDQFIMDNEFQGEFGQSAPGYQWQAEFEETETDSLYRMDMTVSWLASNDIRSIECSTIFKSENAIIQEAQQ